jgi:phenylacetate-CoA ligase
MRGAVSLMRLARNQWRSREELERRQLAALRGLLRHAEATVPFYQRLYREAGVSIDEIEQLEDLQRLPIVRRQDIQSLPESELVTRDVDLSTCIRTHTSGSTGVSLAIISRPGDRAAFNPSFFRVYLGWGLKPWHRLTYFQARPESLSQRSWFESLGIFRRQMLFSRHEPEVWIAGLRRWRPHMIHGYSLTLKLLAEALSHSGITDIHVPLVVSTSGVLDGAARELLHATLGCRVADIYASEEAGGVIAWECPLCPGYHLGLDTVIVELVKDGRPVAPGEDGTVLITNLSNFTMPFIRYDQGDVARRSARQPVCGRGFPLMDSVCGRAGDYVLLPTGRKLTPHPFFLVLDHAIGVGQWQIIQDRVERITVRMTRSHGDVEPEPEDVRSKIRELVGDGVEIEVAVVDQLPTSPSYKLRSVISLLPEAQTPGGASSLDSG